MVQSSLVTFVGHPIDTNMSCKEHPNGCGKVLAAGDIVVCDAHECEFVKGGIYFIAARILDSEGHKSCKVGLFKCLFHQVNLIAHRVGKVVKIEQEGKSKNTTQYACDHCRGVATIRFLDGGI